MAPISYSASAPGTLMLMGEHAVLHHKRALVFSVDKKIKVTLIPRMDNTIIIHSTLGKLEISLNNLLIQKPFQFVIAAIAECQTQLKSGFELAIVSEFSSKVGLGSSAAVTVATLGVLYQFMDPAFDLDRINAKYTIFEKAKDCIRSVQGMGSGADVAACVFGGIIVYQQKSPFILQQIQQVLPLIVVYSGSKMPTPEVVKIVQEKEAKYPDIFESLYIAMEVSVKHAITVIENNDWKALGEIVNIQHGIMNALGVATPHLNKVVDLLNQDPNIFGAKISGSGLGDCIIGIGESSSLIETLSLLNDNAIAPVLVRGTIQGLVYE